MYSINILLIIILLGANYVTIPSMFLYLKRFKWAGEWLLYMINSIICSIYIALSLYSSSINKIIMVFIISPIVWFVLIILSPSSTFETWDCYRAKDVKRWGLRLGDNPFIDLTRCLTIASTISIIILYIIV